MRSNAKLDALVTRNIADLEAAFIHARDVTSERLFKLLHSVVQQGIDAASWHVGFDADDNDLWAAPRAWLVVGKSPVKAHAWFVFDELFEEDLEETETWLSALTAASSGVAKTALFFRQERLGKQAWKKLVKSKLALRDTISAKGFTYDLEDGEFYHPVIIDQEALAAGFEDGTPEQAFGPMRTAVQAMIDCVGLFDEMMADIPED